MPVLDHVLLLAALLVPETVTAANGNCDNADLRDPKFRDDDMCRCHTDCWQYFVRDGRRLETEAGLTSRRHMQSNSEYSTCKGCCDDGACASAGLDVGGPACGTQSSSPQGWCTVGNSCGQTGGLCSTAQDCIALTEGTKSCTAESGGAAASSCDQLSVQATITSRGIDPDTDFLFSSPRATWEELCDVVVAWNARFPAKPFLAEASDGNNILTLSAFLGNAAQESANFQACGEYVAPCPAQFSNGEWNHICSGGAPDDYADENWGTCYQTPIVSSDSFSKGGSLPANACGTSPTCTDWADRPLSGTSCWFGRGAIQLTWNCNYAKANVLLSELGQGIDICADPSSICDNGKSFWGGSLAYWMQNVHDAYMQDHVVDTAMACIKNGCSGPWVDGEGTWTGSGHAVRRENYRRYLGMLTGGVIPSPSPSPGPTPSPHCSSEAPANACAPCAIEGDCGGTGSAPWFCFIDYQCDGATSPSTSPSPSPSQSPSPGALRAEPLGPWLCFCVNGDS